MKNVPTLHPTLAVWQLEACTCSIIEGCLWLLCWHCKRGQLLSDTYVLPVWGCRWAFMAVQRRPKRLLVLNLQQHAPWQASLHWR